jgi:hypothetical protein
MQIDVYRSTQYLPCFVPTMSQIGASRGLGVRLLDGGSGVQAPDGGFAPMSRGEPERFKRSTKGILKKSQSRQDARVIGMQATELHGLEHKTSVRQPSTAKILCPSELCVAAEKDEKATLMAVKSAKFHQHNSIKLVLPTIQLQKLARV